MRRAKTRVPLVTLAIPHPWATLGSRWDWSDRGFRLATTATTMILTVFPQSSAGWIQLVVATVLVRGGRCDCEAWAAAVAEVGAGGVLGWGAGGAVGW